MAYQVVVNDAGQRIVLTRNGEVALVDERGREIEKYEVPTGAIIQHEENTPIKEGDVICEWDPHSIPILAETGGKIRFEDIIEDETMRTEQDPSGGKRFVITEHKGDLHPQVTLIDNSGETQAFYYLPEQASIEVNTGDQVAAGQVMAKTPRESGGTQDITGGLPRVTELFEARRPKDPAVITEIDGEISFGDIKRGKREVREPRLEGGLLVQPMDRHGGVLPDSRQVDEAEVDHDGPLRLRQFENVLGRFRVAHVSPDFFRGSEPRLARVIVGREGDHRPPDGAPGAAQMASSPRSRSLKSVMIVLSEMEFRGPE